MFCKNITTTFLQKKKLTTACLQKGIKRCTWRIDAHPQRCFLGRESPRWCRCWPSSLKIYLLWTFFFEIKTVAIINLHNNQQLFELKQDVTCQWGGSVGGQFGGNQGLIPLGARPGGRPEYFGSTLFVSAWIECSLCFVRSFVVQLQLRLTHSFNW